MLYFQELGFGQLTMTLLIKMIQLGKHCEMKNLAAYQIVQNKLQKLINDNT